MTFIIDLQIYKVRDIQKKEPPVTNSGKFWKEPPVTNSGKFWKEPPVTNSGKFWKELF